MKKKILVLNDRYALRSVMINLGDRLLSDGLYRLLQENLDCEIISGGWKNFPYLNKHRLRREKDFPNIEVIFERWYQHICHLVNETRLWEKYLSDFIDKSPLFRNRLFNKIEDKIVAHFSRGLIETAKPFILKKQYAANLIKNINASDIVIYSGGAMVADRFEYYLPMGMFECYLAKKMEKMVVTANQTIDVLDPINRKMVSFVYKKLDLHITREPLSRRPLIGMNIPERKILISADSAFSANIQIDVPINAIIKKEGIGNDCVGLILRGDRPVNYEAWVKLIDEVVKMGKKIVLLLTCKAHDFKIYKKLDKKCTLKILSEFYDYPILINLMKSLDCVISDRYHGAIMSILANTPVIPINPAYKTLKTEGLFSLFDYPVKVMPPVCEDNYKNVLDIMRYIKNNEESIKKLLSIASMDIRKNCGQVIKGLSNLMKSG